MSVNAGQLVHVRQKMRERIGSLESQIKAINADIALIDAELMEICREQDVNSFSTDYGTVTRVIKERYWASDWEPLHQYVMENGAMDLLERRIHQTNMKEWMKEHKDDHPPGVSLMREYAISVHKPRKKEEA
jgi:hypothetical protein